MVAVVWLLIWEHLRIERIVRHGGATLGLHIVDVVWLELGACMYNVVSTMLVVDFELVEGRS